MKLDKIYEKLNFSTEFSVEDWNSLIELKLKKYFIDEIIFYKNKEILRTEIINYIRFCTKDNYFRLFEWTHNLYKRCIDIDRQQTIKILAELFDETSNTDLKWTTNVMTQPDSTKFSKRDKASYYFKIIDETLEGVFKPRFKLLAKLAELNHSCTIIDNSNSDFGRLIRDFPSQFENEIQLFIKDPIFSININQWRNIAAHKSYTINKENITIEYGRGNIQTRIISYDDFYKIVFWTQDIYRVIRLGQVFLYLNYMEEIVDELGSTSNVRVRYESSLLHIIHNMQIVGFEFVSTEEQGDTFCLNVKGKISHDIKSSLIHGSQCLDQLSCAIYDDEFVKDEFKNVQISIVDEEKNKLASAKISIDIALKKAKGEINLDEYLNNMNFNLQ